VENQETSELDRSVYSFSPVINSQTRILVLGSMPGVRSLQEQAYYAHPQNAFWWIVQELFEIPRNLDYQLRIRQLLGVQIGLWDVLASCQRQGSLDSAILGETETVNDFSKLFSAYPNLVAILFNGQKSHQVFAKHYDLQSLNSSGLKTHTMPSTSPANAAISKTDKLKVWGDVIKVYLLGQ
jgi:hypoxanthine-DNA glycosylase